MNRSNSNNCSWGSTARAQVQDPGPGPPLITTAEHTHRKLVAHTSTQRHANTHKLAHTQAATTRVKLGQRIHDDWPLQLRLLQQCVCVCVCGCVWDRCGSTAGARLLPDTAWAYKFAHEPAIIAGKWNKNAIKVDDDDVDDVGNPVQHCASLFCVKWTFN